MLTGIVSWALLLVAVVALVPYPAACTIPLAVLLVTFEVIRPLHFGAERIGRYLQVFYEERGQLDRSIAETPAWERVAMSFSTVPGTGGHPLFVPIFFLATVANYVAMLIAAPLPVELVTMAVPHVAFMVWMLRADRAMRAQRAAELKTLRALWEGGHEKRSS